MEMGAFRMAAAVLIAASALCVTGARAKEGAVAARDPFWPVGYAPKDTTTPVVVEAPPPPVVETPQTNEPPKVDPWVIEQLAAELQAKIKARLKFSGFMTVGNRMLATVNGQVIGVADRLNVEVDGQAYRFKVTAITPTAVKLEPVN